MSASINSKRSANTIARLAALGAGLMLLILAMSATIRLGQAGCGHEGAAEIVIASARAIHRLAASLAGILLLALAWLAYRAQVKPHGRVPVFVLLFALTSFLAVVGRFSGANILPAVTLGNIVAGMAMAALFCRLRSLYIARSCFHDVDEKAPVVGLTRMFAALQIWCGSWLAAMAGAANCGAIPSQDKWTLLPNMEMLRALNPFAVPVKGIAAMGDALNWLQLMHELSATVVVIMALVLGIRLIRREAEAVAKILLTLVAIQLVVALWQIFIGTHWYLGVAHNFVAAILLAGLTSIQLRKRTPG